jgi:hypothetical protein
MPKVSRTPALPRARSARQSGHTNDAVVTCSAPLLQLQAHWTMQVHPRYLEAATFLWPH